MVEKSSRPVDILNNMNRARTISITGLILAFLASALSVLTGNLSSNSDGRTLAVITVSLWLLAILGMMLWLFGRSAMRKAASEGGWFVQNVHAAALDENYQAFLVLFEDHLEAEKKYADCVRTLRSGSVPSPVRLDLSWLKPDGSNDIRFAISAFFALGEGEAESKLSDCFKYYLEVYPDRLIQDPGAKEHYFRSLGGCGASMWIE